MLPVYLCWSSLYLDSSTKHEERIRILISVHAIPMGFDFIWHKMKMGYCDWLGPCCLVVPTDKTANPKFKFKGSCAASIFRIGQQKSEISIFKLGPKFSSVFIYIICRARVCVQNWPIFIILILFWPSKWVLQNEMSSMFKYFFFFMTGFRQSHYSTFSKISFFKNKWQNSNLKIISISFAMLFN